MATARPHFASLDGLRCLAIVPVVWHHATPRPLDGVLGRGPLGVDLFFALSGFLITKLLLHERGRSGSIALGAFYARRGLRIFPLYYLVLTLFVAHALLVREPGPARDYFLHSIPLYATYTSNWFQHGAIGFPIVFAFAWSLAAEEQFYLVWPPILRASRGLLLPATFMLSLVLLDQAAERGWLAGVLREGLGLRMLRSIATPIGLGSLLALAAEHPRAKGVIRAVLGRRISSVVALSAVLAATIFGWSLLETHIAMTALVGACALRPDHLLAPLFENRVARHVGAVSYGIYLLNVPVVSATRAIVGDAHPLFVFVIALGGSVTIASLSYRHVERPFLLLRDRLRPTPAEADVLLQSAAIVARRSDCS